MPFYLAGLDLVVAAFSGTGKKHRLYAAAAGVVLGYSNTIRSGALIALVSLMLCLTVKIVRAPGERRAELLKSLACVLVCFLAVQAGYSAFRTAVCAGKSAGMTYGWTLYEGLDIETAGGWRRENLDVLTEAIETLPLGQVQPYLLRKAAERVSAYSAGDWVSLFLRKGINIWIYNDYGYSMLRWMDSAVISDLTAFEPYVRLLCNFCYLSGLMAMALSMLWAATGKVRRGQAGFGIILMTLQVLIMALWDSFGTSIPRYRYYLLPLMPLTVCLCLQPVECQRAVRG